MRRRLRSLVFSCRERTYLLDCMVRGVLFGSCVLYPAFRAHRVFTWPCLLTASTRLGNKSSFVRLRSVRVTCASVAMCIHVVFSTSNGSYWTCALISVGVERVDFKALHVDNGFTSKPSTSIFRMLHLLRSQKLHISKYTVCVQINSHHLSMYRVCSSYHYVCMTEPSVECLIYFVQIPSCPHRVPRSTVPVHRSFQTCAADAILSLVVWKPKHQTRQLLSWQVSRDGITQNCSPFCLS